MSSLAVVLSPPGMHVAFPTLKPAPALHMLHQDFSTDCNCALCCVDASNVAMRSQLSGRDNPSWELHAHALASTGLCPCHPRLRGIVLCRWASKKAQERLAQQKKSASFQQRFPDSQVMAVYHMTFEICLEGTCRYTSGKAEFLNRQKPKCFTLSCSRAI